MYKYLFLICFSIIIFMLLNDIDTFNIGSHLKNSERYIITNCNRDISSVEHYWTEGYKTSKNIQYIDIKTFNDNITYKLSVALSSKVVNFMKYSSDFTSENDINFASNLCRLLKKIQFIVSEMCKNLDENYIRNIATISEDSDGTIDFLNPLNAELDNIRCIYIYYDDNTSSKALQYIENNPTPLVNDYDVQWAENPCNFCPYHDLIGLNTSYPEEDRLLCGNTMAFEGDYSGNLVISLSDVYHYNQIEEKFHTNYSILVHEFAHNILENGIANYNYDKREEFNNIYQEYVNLINNDSELNCSEIYACYGSKYGMGQELFAVASETWFSYPEIQAPYIDNIDHIRQNFLNLYNYLQEIYGPPNPLCNDLGGCLVEDDLSSMNIPLSIGAVTFLGAIGLVVKRCAATLSNEDYNELTCGDIPGEV